MRTARKKNLHSSYPRQTGGISSGRQLLCTVVIDEKKEGLKCVTSCTNSLVTQVTTLDESMSHVRALLVERLRVRLSSANICVTMCSFREKTNEDLVRMTIAPVERARWIEKPVELRLPSFAAEETASPQQESLSKRQRKKARKEKAGNSVCFNFANNRCFYGDKCKFNHDLAAFAASRPPDLPGQCPFASQKGCSFGIMCRWAATHADESARPISINRPPGSDGAAPDTRGDQPTGPNSAGEGDDAGLIPSQVIELPTLPAEQPTMNALDKHVQAVLRRRAYDFTKADNLVEDLGAKVTYRKPKGAAGDVQKQNGECDSKDPPDDSPAKRQRHEEAQMDSLELGSAKAAAGAEALCRHSLDGEALKTETRRGLQSDGSLLFDARDPKGEMWAQLHAEGPLKPQEKSRLDFRGKLYLAPLTTVGNLPFRRVCKGLGADMTCGEMALATCLLQGQSSEWALLKRHPCEDLFGVQVCGSHADSMTRCAQLLEENVHVDFVDINMGCPIDLICSKGAGSSLLQKPQRMEHIVKGMSRSLSCPLTIKVRRGYADNQDVAHQFLPSVAAWGVAAATVHGRSREQRYSRLADWGYIATCAEAAAPLPLIGNGDVFSFTEYEDHMSAFPQLATTMLARGALIKPWLFTEIKERRHWDISAGERLDLLKQFCSAGLLHWGSDEKGVETTRRFLLEWLSFLCRYIPVGVLEVLPQKLNWRPPNYYGRSDLETLMASQDPASWVAISKLLLGPTPPGFTFAPKHKSNSYGSEKSMSLEDGDENG